MLDPAKKIYESIKDKEGLLDIVSNKIEDCFLEFKRKNNCENSDLDKEFQRAIAKEVSAFANTEGGVIIIGIDDPKKGPRKLMPIQPLLEFYQKVSSYISQSVSFPLEGVLVKSIATSKNSKKGIVVVYVPAGDRAPYRSLKDNHYYTRSTDGSILMTHSQVVDIFQRSKSPFIMPYLELGRDRNDQSKIEAIFGLENNGKVICKFPFIAIDKYGSFKLNKFGIDGHGNHGLPCHKSIGFKSDEFRGGVDNVIYPSVKLPVARIFQNISTTTNGTLDPSVNDILLEGRIVAERFQLKKWKIVVTKKN